MTIGAWLPYLAAVPVFCGLVLVLTQAHAALWASRVLFAWAAALEEFSRVYSQAQPARDGGRLAEIAAELRGGR